MLKRVISLPKKVQNNKKIISYRNWKNNMGLGEKRGQLPYVVLVTEEYQVMAPTQLLPVHITMMTKEDFRLGLDSRNDVTRNNNNSNNGGGDGGGGGNHNIYNLQFHCPKKWSKNDVMSAEPDGEASWARLTQTPLTSTMTTTSTTSMMIPEALKRAWIEWLHRQASADHSMLQDLS
jgi:hypothetical protein